MADAAKPMGFQGLILDLQRYWAAQGCVILQPLDMEVGAGTFHPATTLRALGPTPWKAAYVQPSRRPTDGRYGENPNRLQHYYQLQVILKPAPADSQQLYLDSLAAIGIVAYLSAAADNQPGRNAARSRRYRCRRPGNSPNPRPRSLVASVVGAAVRWPYGAAAVASPAG